MSTVHDIEAAIEKLPREDFFALVDRLRARYADDWDRQIEEDAKTGRLDALYARLETENRGNSEEPLGEILDDRKLP